MTNIDEKLREILSDDDAHFYEVDKVVAQIKQAFADEGYAKFYYKEIDKNYYTGQEWYDRFEKEIEDSPILNKIIYTQAEELLIDAAKRAAGIEEKK